MSKSAMMIQESGDPVGKPKYALEPYFSVVFSPVDISGLNADYFFPTPQIAT
jgi:hypothetical protein